MIPIPSLPQKILPNRAAWLVLHFLVAWTDTWDSLLGNFKNSILEIKLSHFLSAFSIKQEEY